MTARLIITDHSFPSLDFERELLNGEDVELEYVQATSEREVVDAIEGADAVLATNAPITSEVFEAGDDLQVVGRYGIGVDTVDVEAATEAGVQVVNVASYCEEEVSTHALALLLSVVRRTAAFDREIRAEKWDWMEAIPLQRLGGKTVGFAGFGKIAHNLLKKMQGFDVDFVAYDPYLSGKEVAEFGAEKLSFDEFVGAVDIVSVHTPLTEETAGLFDASVFERMDDSAVLVNTSRGGVVDIEALSQAVESGEIYGAGLDVLPHEPPEAGEIVDHDRIVYTPHVGWYSEEAMAELRQTAISGILDVLNGKEPANRVNTLEKNS
jgi:D-3-phosphoglycerate dehydrogenase